VRSTASTVTTCADIERIFPRFAAAFELANELVAGPDPDVPARVRAVIDFLVEITSPKRRRRV